MNEPRYVVARTTDLKKLSEFLETANPGWNWRLVTVDVEGKSATAIWERIR
jgi:hypothetical protein